MMLQEQIERVLREYGLSDRPDIYDSSIHSSWRCELPDKYGHCDCFQELLDDLKNAFAEWLATSEVEVVVAQAMLGRTATLGAVEALNALINRIRP